MQGVSNGVESKEASTFKGKNHGKDGRAKATTTKAVPMKVPLNKEQQPNSNRPTHLVVELFFKVHLRFRRCCRRRREGERQQYRRERLR